MVHRVKEQDGYILIHFGPPPANLDEAKFVVIVAHQQGQILYSRLREDRSWTLPGGRVNSGETSEQAAHREFLEETGATLKQIQIMCYLHCFMFGREYWGIAYLGEIDRLGVPTDLDEVMETAMFADVPIKIPPRSEGEVRALHSAALKHLAGDKNC